LFIDVQASHGEDQARKACKLAPQAAAERSAAAKAKGILLECVAPEHKKRRLGQLPRVTCGLSIETR